MPPIPRCGSRATVGDRMTGLSTRQIADLVDRVRETVGPWESLPVGPPARATRSAAVVAVLFGLRHNMDDDRAGRGVRLLAGHDRPLPPNLQPMLC
jgi:hypothetical protein